MCEDYIDRTRRDYRKMISIVFRCIISPSDIELSQRYFSIIAEYFTHE